MNAAYVAVADLRALLPEIPEATIVSRTIFNETGGRAILFGFAPGQELSEHTSSLAAILHILEGQADLTLGGEPVEAGPGAFVYMPPNLPHSVYAKEQVVMLLTMIKAGQ